LHVIEAFDGKTMRDQDAPLTWEYLTCNSSMGTILICAFSCWRIFIRVSTGP